MVISTLNKSSTGKSSWTADSIPAKAQICIRIKEKESEMERSVAKTVLCCNFSNLTALFPSVQLSVLGLVYFYWKKEVLQFLVL